jgi:hypothetical protein
VRAALTRATKNAELAAPAPTLHDLRHSHASMLIAMDCSLVDVQHQLGHRKPDTTLRIYTRQWQYRDAQPSRIGQQLDPLFHTRPKQLNRAPRALRPRSRQRIASDKSRC